MELGGGGFFFGWVFQSSYVVVGALGGEEGMAAQRLPSGGGGEIPPSCAGSRAFSPGPQVVRPPQPALLLHLITLIHPSTHNLAFLFIIDHHG